MRTRCLAITVYVRESESMRERGLYCVVKYKLVRPFITEEKKKGQMANVNVDVMYISCSVVHVNVMM